MADFGALFDKKRKLSAVEPAGGGSNQKKKKKKDGRPAEPTVLDSSAVTATSSASSKKKKRKKERQQQQQQQQQQQRQLPTTLLSSMATAGGSDDRHQRRMATQIAGAQFRYINETLYTRPSAEAVEMFREEPRLYEAYHEGFRVQAARWPQRPVQIIADWLKATQPASHVVADLGCGDAELATSVPQRVRSFDLVACNELVTACDIAAVPLADGSVHVAVFCLALMGVNFAAFLQEAYRLLKPRGLLKIAEVTSRITDTDGWERLLHSMGFDEVSRDSSNTHFVMFEYVKSARPPADELPSVALKACIYKKR